MSNNIYVTGHRNPDMDSIVASIAYANLRNSLGDNDYKAVRIGEINDETKSMLGRFGFEAPPLVKTMRTQVSDLDYDKPPIVNDSVTLDLAWRTMQEANISVLPVMDDYGKLHGMLSTGNIAAHELASVYDNRVDNVPLFNIISVLEGRLVNEFGTDVTSISGNVVIALPQSFTDYSELSKRDILICGSQPDVISAAVNSKVCCLILCQTEIPVSLKDVTDTCVISTPLDARTVARLIFQAVPVCRVCETEKVQAFYLTDYLDDVKEMMFKSRLRCYPILDENDMVVGTLSRYHLLRPNRKRVVLVDHNEAAQSVRGLDQVEIMEIIDHHRLADIQTSQPISVRNEPVGCTCTIITAMYQEKGVVPPPAIAALMACAIISDTVMFKSPTCTKRDIAMAERLSRIAKVSLEELGKEIFSAGASDDKSAEEIFKNDFKEFHISEKNLGVSQITCADSSKLMNRSNEFLAVMEKLQKDREYDIIILMITDVLSEGTHLFFCGKKDSDDIIQQAFGVEPKYNHVYLPRIMSRKKQIIPMLTALWG